MNNIINLIGLIGLICGSLRVIPQTISTISTRETKNLSYLYFFMHLLAAIFGLRYEYVTNHISIFNVLFFVMVIVTNAVQIFCMIYFRWKSLKRQTLSNIDID